MKSLRTMNLSFVIISLIALASLCMAAERDVVPAGQVEQTIEDNNGIVTVRMEWLTRPGEFALEIDYFGYLTQEGPVNLFLMVNGVTREFLTLKEEMPNRHQRVRILSFHPTTTKKGPNALKKLSSAEMVDYLLFKNAPYYPQFGEVLLEMKFFANGRWDGDGNNSDGNFRFVMKNPLKMSEPVDHF